MLGLHPLNLCNKRIEYAYLLAKEAHKGQKRWKGEDYFENHVSQVAGLCEELSYPPITGKLRDKLIRGALLHDVVEDTNVTLDEIYFQFDREIGDAVDAITKQENEPYVDYIKRCSKNKLARIVKIQDIKHNTSDPTTLSINKLRLYELAIAYMELAEELASIKEQHEST